MHSMAARQGLNRLLAGAEKRITPSEIARGYFFITHDKLAIAALGNNDFDVSFGKYVLKDKHIDAYGRISVGRAILREFKDKVLVMRIDGKNLVIKPART
jgi:hypothetical protein